MLIGSLSALIALIASSSISISAITVCDIQGTSFRSPLAGQMVEDVIGFVTAKDKYGAWIVGEPSQDPRVSNGLRIYGSTPLRNVKVEDAISLSGRVTEYRPKYSPNDLFLTELDLIRDINILSHGNEITPVLLGKERIPPIGQLSASDDGPDGWLSIPNNMTLLESVNATLQPDLYGLDFWKSLEGQLVTVPKPVAANFPDRFGSIWIYGDWPVDGKNTRGGLSLTSSDFGDAPDAHPGAILLGYPLDDTNLPRTQMGTALSNVTGVVTYQYGNYYILPLTAPSVLGTPNETVSPSSLISEDNACSLTIGDYNVENMGPRSHHLQTIAMHIANYLSSPDIMFLQEIQDDSGTKDDGTVSANKTLSRLTSAIASATHDEVHYKFTNVEPEDNVDGGQPGGNIRVAYLWRPEKVSLVPGSPVGNATEATEVVLDDKGQLTLSRNPGRIDPRNAAWDGARKPIAAVWQTTTGERFYTVNVHYSSKRDSSSAQGDARPPVNGKSDQRTAQVNVTATFVQSLLVQDPNAHIIVGGDMNEFIQTSSVFAPFEGLLSDVNEVAGISKEERYTYVYEQHAQEIDHIFLSKAVAVQEAEVEHVHLNTWADSKSAQASDHDPTVAKIWACAREEGMKKGRTTMLVAILSRMFTSFAGWWPRR
ncbi:endonuclease/exonuclease/phosphatase [Laetiporus sulphureus 93-53]|uniref:Endonuclease/exonuclease/phosphatase n=1 Tax=Laetiporus sulphureus 93-53 TaxID=1314785 RepID=A0A165ES53_9APHY|nr:endonuclease/exonuclease/phosphatase [Laetiporus sulphureus 93-53]KZT07652.1 endonuclease/exonuclease/phosphatase [Laetiporus sulphureus 93-53]